MARQPSAIDRDNLHGAVRKLGREYVFYMLDGAIDLLPPDRAPLARPEVSGRRESTSFDGAPRSSRKWSGT